MRAHALVATAALAVLASLPAQAQNFRFLCNGIDANGQTDGDGCSSCTASNASRWQPAAVEYSYDFSTRPSEVSSSRWSSETAAARNAWHSASPALSLTDSGQSAIREFGSEDGSNSIYWILTSSEWNADHIGGINSTFGVTIALNARCSGGQLTGDKTILDSDTVLNGTGVFDWSFFSSLGTLTHEMGHGLGLGHPCTDSCGELMAAASSGGPNGCGDTGNCFDPTGPQGGDIQGIQSLYPAPGALGSSCSGGGCNNGLECDSVGGTSFCTQTCTGTCPNGMVCSTVAGQGQICVFSSSPIAQPGESCNPPGCANACAFDNQGVPAVAPGCNICLGASGTQDQCFAGCTVGSNTGCPANTACSPLDGAGANAGVCVPSGSALRGQPCDQNNLCVDGVECVLETQTSGFCRGTCDGTSGAGCDNTETCLAAFGDGTAACFPHGQGGDGASCSAVGNTTDCARGLLCLQDSATSNTCHGICTQGYQCPGAGESCVASGIAGLQVCVGGSTGEGEGEGSAGEGEGEGEGPPPPGGCRITRGNFDCPNTTDACVLANENDLVGTCGGTPGTVKTFDSCTADGDCTSGLCVNGVCTRPCDVGACPGGYDCDAGRAPAGEVGGTPGICVPQSCAADHSICSSADGFHCIYNEAQHYTCSKDGSALCACTTTSSTPAYAGVAALLGLAGLLTRRRRA